MKVKYIGKVNFVVGNQELTPGAIYDIPEKLVKLFSGKFEVAEQPKAEVKPEPELETESAAIVTEEASEPATQKPKGKR